MRASRRTALGTLLCAVAVCRNVTAAESPHRPTAPDSEIEIGQLRIVGTPSIPGLDQPLDQVPENVQVFDAADLERRGSATLPDFLGRAAGNVHLSQSQNNPFQPDVTYRGFAGSGVLGTEQGISVYQDGVRLNEFLGDTINWDLISQNALGSLEIVPGADPRYGWNTLGGAVLLQTKRGFTDPGTRAESSYGTFGRWQGLIEHGGSRGAFDYFAVGDFVREDGFRDFSPSRLNRAFSELGWRDGDDDLRVTYTHARNNLAGAGFVPQSLLADDRDAVYTHPDTLRPDLDFVSVIGRRVVDLGTALHARAYFRNLYLRQENGDAAEASPDEVSGSLPAVLRTIHSHQRRYGGGVGAEYASLVLGVENEMTAGLDVEGGDASFRLAEARGVFDSSRGVVATGPAEPRTDVDSDGEAVGLYLRDALSPISTLTLTSGLRYERQHLALDDQLSGAASGNHTFDGIDPSIGITFRPLPQLNFFARYGESHRAPTAVELTCASEAAPCPLPIAFVQDPPLATVRSRSFEAGLRAEPFAAFRVALAAFRTDLDDDILFVARTSSLGFFRNVGTTRRQGIEAFLDGSFSGTSWFVSYGYTRATFETTETFPSPNGEDIVHPGDILPGVPDHLLKAGLDAPLWAGLRLTADLQYTGRQFVRTDEANQQPPLCPYTIVNAGLAYTYGAVTLFARAENLFDAQYESFGTQGQNVFAAGRVERFLSPGAPLGGWFGARIAL